MKRLYNIFAVMFLTLIAATSCSKEEPFDYNNDEKDAFGQVSMKKMLVEITNEENVVRSSIDVGTFIVAIEKNGVAVNTYQYKDMPEILTLPVGDYSVKVKSHNVEAAAWDSPYFEGSESFTIEENKIAEVTTVVCKLANVRVTVNYDAKLKAVMGADCKVNVVVGQNGMLDFVKEETRSGYFEYVEGSSTMVATFSGTVEDNYEENFRTYVDVAPGNHYIITYTLHTPGGDVPEPEGTITAGLIVDATVTSEDMTINVDSEDEILTDDERPTEGDESGEDPEDPNDPVNPEDPDKPAPSVEAQDPITFDSPNVVTASSTVVINVTSEAENGIEVFEVNIVSDILTPEELQAVGLTDKLDLVNPGEYEEALIGLGFPVNVGGSKELSVDISQFMGLLAVLGSGSHDFVLTVGDANGTTVKTLTLVIE